jgi:hypothetical protein
MSIPRYHEPLCRRPLRRRSAPRGEAKARRRDRRTAVATAVPSERPATVPVRKTGPRRGSPDEATAGAIATGRARLPHAGDQPVKKAPAREGPRGGRDATAQCRPAAHPRPDPPAAPTPPTARGEAGPSVASTRLAGAHLVRAGPMAVGGPRVPIGSVAPPPLQADDAPATGATLSKHAQAARPASPAVSVPTVLFAHLAHLPRAEEPVVRAATPRRDLPIDLPPPAPAGGAGMDRRLLRPARGARMPSCPAPPARGAGMLRRQARRVRAAGMLRRQARPVRAAGMQRRPARPVRGAGMLRRQARPVRAAGMLRRPARPVPGAGTLPARTPLAGPAGPRPRPLLLAPFAGMLRRPACRAGTLRRPPHPARGGVPGRRPGPVGRRQRNGAAWPAVGRAPSSRSTRPARVRRTCGGRRSPGRPATAGTNRPGKRGLPRRRGSSKRTLKSPIPRHKGLAPVGVLALEPATWRPGGRGSLLPVAGADGYPGRS